MDEESPHRSGNSLLDSLRERVVRAGRWVYEVLQGYTWGRHLDQREK